jgi:rhodanese-related sulfurtransferase
MKKLFALSVLAAFVVAAFATPASFAQQPEAPRISLEDAKKAYDAGTAYIIDARGEDSYKDEHIKSAINITSDSLKEKLKTLPKDKTIIVYCS